MSDLQKEIKAAARKLHFQERGSLSKWMCLTKKFKNKKRALNKKKCRKKIKLDY